MADETSLDQDSPVPLYEQLVTLLKKQIEQGTLRGRLPGEERLAVEYGISRVTVRRAIALLREAGLVEATRGRGTFVVRRGERRPEP